MKIVNGIGDAKSILMSERIITDNSPSYTKSVEEIIQYVRTDGDAAVLELTEKFDGIICAAATKEYPEDLLEFLEVGGKLVIPVGFENKQK